MHWRDEVAAVHVQLARGGGLDAPGNIHVEELRQLDRQLHEVRGSVLEVDDEPGLRELPKGDPLAPGAALAIAEDVCHECITDDLGSQAHAPRVQRPRGEGREGEGLRPISGAFEGPGRHALVEGQGHAEQAGAVAGLLYEVVPDDGVPHLPAHCGDGCQPLPDSGSFAKEPGAGRRHGLPCRHPEEHHAEVRRHRVPCLPLLGLHEAEQGLRWSSRGRPLYEEARLRARERGGEHRGVAELAPIWPVGADGDGVEVLAEVLQRHPKDTAVLAEIVGTDLGFDFRCPILVVLVVEGPLPLQPCAPRVPQLH
mmetsp:Transcript_9751/g.28309  ORF Transcript_9751/g.28309 Transcript_9751/m.28309 type:complete len:311 (-) Transcript_9751:1250-2182(-)